MFLAHRCLLSSRHVLTAAAPGVSRFRGAKAAGSWARMTEQAVDKGKAERKAAKKAAKAAARAKREGTPLPGAGQKQCDECNKGVDLLIRCQTDASGRWRMVCGKCWKGVSGGVVDGDAAHPHYRYGGLWKNRTVK